MAREGEPILVPIQPPKLETAEIGTNTEFNPKEIVVIRKHEAGFTTISKNTKFGQRSKF